MSSISPHISVLLDEGAQFLSVAHAAASSPGSLPIGAVRFGRPGDGTHITIQSCSVDALLALADAAQEAARQLRARQIAEQIQLASARVSA